MRFSAESASMSLYRSLIDSRYNRTHMKPEPTVSVCLTTCNGEEFLKEQLESLAQQSQLPCELVVCDDASTDRTIDILEQFAAKSPFPVRIFRNSQRLGYERNFMRAADLCTGHLVAFCDQDDLWEPHKLEHAQACFASHSARLMIHDFRVFFANGTPALDSYFSLLQQCGYRPSANLKGCSMVARRSFLQAVGWPHAELLFSHDMWMVLSALALEQAVYCPEPLMQHRIHEHNTSGRVPTPIASRWRWLLRQPSLSLTESTDLESMLTAMANMDSIAHFEQALAQLRPLLSAEQDQRAAHAMAARRALLEFRSHTNYPHAGYRIPKLCELLSRNAYRLSRGWIDVLKDFFGKSPIQLELGNRL